MIQLSGIFSESLGGTCTIRGYAKYNEIVELSYPHPGYQRPAEDEHVAEISSFITSGSNSFSPEVVLAYTAKYNYYAQGASSEVDALADIRSGKGFTSNVDGIAIFNRYVRSTEQTIFMSRCFSAEYNETENAIRRAINEINNEKKTGIMLIRVDEHHEGTTGQISDRIFRDIESAGLVIADLSSGKLNVPHEIGYAMGLKKDLILVHNGTSEEAEKHIPSNIRMFEQIRFNGDYQTLQNEIKRRLIDYYKL